MKFKIISQCFQKMDPGSDSGDVDFYLEEDKWDDYHFHTLYHIHAGSKRTKGVPEYLGPVNIMRKGQKEDDYYLVRKTLGVGFSELSDEFCSMSMSVELYRGLDRLLKRAKSRRRFVDALKMIFSTDEERYLEFKDEECFQTSLLRNATMGAYGLIFGKEIMLDEASSYDLAKIPLTYTLPDDNGEVDFDFGTVNQDIDDSIDIPSRLLVCIGNNGAGKSTILYRLARILYATPSARSAYSEDVGMIYPSDAGFRRLFLISYSAFDNFILPGLDSADYKQILDGLKTRHGRLVCCGIRDVESEYENKIKDETERDRKKESEDKDAPLVMDKDHESFHRLKSVDNLSREFSDALHSIARDDRKFELWNELMDECESANTSLEDMKLTSFTRYFEEEMVSADDFKLLSTGIKYLLHSLSSIVDRIETNSIIIFDEPENHIQPPLLCKFLYCLRLISQRYKSLVLVATHSPVIVQETLAKNVIIVNRTEDKWSFRHPSIETYGENIGNITDEVFNLNTSVTNYQKTAARLYDLYHDKIRHTSDPIRFLKSISEETGIEFGNEIKAYLISRYIENNN